jgi:hypothetical protein
MVNRAKRLIRQMIGRAQKVTLTLSAWWSTAVTKDWSRRDYAFWDKARHCEARGLELSGLFLKPLASKTAAWVQGTVPRWTVADSPRGQEALSDWWADNHALILRAYEDAVGLADSFIVVNADDGFSVTILPPNVVTPIVDEQDFSRLIGWKVTEVHPHPSKPGVTMTITDEYTAVERVRTRYRNGVRLDEERYPNLIGLVPVIHVANNQSADSMFGEPEGAALLPLLQRYGTTLEAALSGNIHQGRPTPVAEFESVDQMTAFWDMARATGLIHSETVTHPDGTSETYDEIDFDSDKFMALAGGKFRYEQPGSFAQDTERLLGLLFYLFLQHTEIPEFVWGNAIASSKASAETQLLPFLKWVEKKRGECSGWMLELARVVLAYVSLVEPGVKADAPLSLAWEPLTTQDDQLTLAAISWAYAEGLLDDATALEMLPLDIQDVSAVLEAAKAQRDERQQSDRDSELAIRRALDLERQRQEEADAMTDDEQDLEDAA